MRPVVAALLALTLTVPAFSSHGHRPADPVREVRAELAEIERLTLQVRDWRLRSQMTTHLANAQYLLGEVDRPERAERCPADSLRYEDAHTLVQRERWDSDRLAVVERIGRRSCLTTEQVRSIVSLFDFDSSKERALIALYPSVIDKARFELALDVLTWSSSRQTVASALGI